MLWLVLSFVLAAFAEEIFWAGITSTPKGQWEAARSTGLTLLRARSAYVVLPQAIRLTVPPLTNRTIAITKNTALGTVIGVGEILNQATTAQSFTGNATPLMMGAIAYIVLFVPVVALGRWIETRFCLAEGLMDTILDQFLNFEIMARGLAAACCSGLGTTAYSVRAGHSARACRRPAGGAAVAVARARRGAGPRSRWSISSAPPRRWCC